MLKVVDTPPENLRIDFVEDDASDIRYKLGWSPKYDLETLVSNMIVHSINVVREMHL